MKKVSTHLWVLNSLLEYLRQLHLFSAHQKTTLGSKILCNLMCKNRWNFKNLLSNVFHKISPFFQYCIVSWYNKVFNNACRQTPLICSFLKPLLHLLVCAFRNAIPPRRGHQKTSKAKCKSWGILVEMWVPSEFYWFQWSYSRFQLEKIGWEHRLQYKFSRQLISSS